MALEAHASLSKALAPLHNKSTALYSLIKDEERINIKKWEDEVKPSTEQLISSLSQGLDILKQQKKAQAKDLQARLDKIAQANAAIKAASQVLKHVDTETDVEELQLKLVQLNNRVLDVDFALKDANEELAKCHPNEREIISTKIVCLQVFKLPFTSHSSASKGNPTFHMLSPMCLWQAFS